MKHMKKVLLVRILVVLLVATGIVAAIHLKGQEEINCMVIEHAALRIDVTFADLDKGAFSGELTDGKGDTSAHTYTGILLRELLEAKGIDLARLSGVTITSADNYSVRFTAEEILETDKVYLAITVDGKTIEGIDPGTEGVQVIVFGDENSRRCVRFAKKITIATELKISNSLYA